MSKNVLTFNLAESFDAAGYIRELAREEGDKCTVPCTCLPVEQQNDQTILCDVYSWFEKLMNE